MSDFRKLLLAFAAVTLLAGIASAGIQPVLSVTAQPHSVRVEAFAPENTLFSFDTGCNMGVPTTPAFLVYTQGTFRTNNAPNNFGAPALPPAPALASGTATSSGNMPDVANTAQAASTIAGTPAYHLNANSSNAALRHLSQTLGSNLYLNGITNTNNNHSVAIDVGNSAADSRALIVANTGHAFISAGNNAANAPASSPAQVARTAPNAAGHSAG